MRCNKCGSDNPDDRRVCGLCGHKLQSGRSGNEEAGETGPAGLDVPPDTAGSSGPGPDGRERSASGDRPEVAPSRHVEREASRLLDFQGWASPLRGLGPYVEACLYGSILAVAVTVCLWVGILWPLYPLLAILAVVAWLRRL